VKDKCPDEGRAFFILGGHAAPARNDTASKQAMNFNQTFSILFGLIKAGMNKRPWQRSLSNPLMKIVHSSSVIERCGMVNIIIRSRKKNKIFSQKEKSFPKE
jgi:hypothetical protein